MQRDIPNLYQFRGSLGAKKHTRRDRVFEAHLIASKLDELVVRAALSGDVHVLPDDVIGTAQVHAWLMSRQSPQLALNVTATLRAEIEAHTVAEGVALEDYVISLCARPLTRRSNGKFRFRQFDARLRL